MYCNAFVSVLSARLFSSGWWLVAIGGPWAAAKLYKAVHHSGGCCTVLFGTQIPRPSQHSK